MTGLNPTTPALASSSGLGFMAIVTLILIGVFFLGACLGMMVFYFQYRRKQEKTAYTKVETQALAGSI